MTNEKLLDKLQKIKAHAESAKAIGNEAEAQAFADMLQRLLLQHDLDMSDLDFTRMTEVEPIGYHPVNFKEGGVKVKNTRSQWQENLAGIVARANFCRFLVHPGSNRITLIGRKSHAAVAEYMIVTLIRTLDRLSFLEAGAYNREQHRVQPCTRCGLKGTEHQDQDHAHHTTAYHGFRESFIAGFIARLFERLKLTRSEVATTSTALARVHKEDAAVNDFMKKLKEDKLTRRVGGLTRRYPSSAAGYLRGQDAADKVNLGEKAVGQGASVRRLGGES